MLKVEACCSECSRWVSVTAQVVQWQRGRNFEGVLSLTRDNKVQYARKHSYDYIDASWIVSGASFSPMPVWLMSLPSMAVDANPGA